MSAPPQAAPAPAQAAMVPVTSCQLCGGTAVTKLFREDPYTVVRCARCSLVWVTPRHHTDLLHELVYGEHYWRSDAPRERGYADYTRDEKLYLRTFRRRMRFVRRQLPAGTRWKVLDVGCAAGFFLRVAREAGHDVYGVELSEPIAREARRHLGDAHVHVGMLDGARGPGFERGSFDLVTLWDVVEHVPDPQALLQQARAMLRPGGVLILETQNVTSRFARLLGPRWHHYKHAEHLYHFDPRTIRELLAQAGFQVAAITPRFGGKYVSLRFIVERSARLHRSLRWLLSPLQLLGGLSCYVNLRDEMLVVAHPTV